MAFANYFYNSLTRKYVIVFGSLFNKLTLNRYDNAGTLIQKMPVPITFAPYQKFLSRLKQDPNFDKKTSATLPMITFELDSLTYDAQRKVGALQKMFSSTQGTDDFVYAPVPYTLHFTLNIWTANMEDGTQLVEQILPFFQPDYTPSVYILDNFDPIDVPISLESVSYSDLYEGEYETRRAIRWTLTFNMAVSYFGPMKPAKRIKFVDVGVYDSFTTTPLPMEQITAQPGLTITGQPTTDINETIPFNQINIDDDWDIIIQYKHN